MIWILLSVVVILIVVSVSVGYKNRLYEKKNRILIIQNDSLMGVNIELSKLIHSKASGSDGSSTKSGN